MSAQDSVARKAIRRLMQRQEAIEGSISGVGQEMQTIRQETEEAKRMVQDVGPKVADIHRALFVQEPGKHPPMSATLQHLSRQVDILNTKHADLYARHISREDGARERAQAIGLEFLKGILWVGSVVAIFYLTGHIAM